MSQLFQSKTNQLIKATITPLASIFGSGFLVVVPILAGAIGEYSILAMVMICGLAYLVGSVIRFNIVNAEPVLASSPARNVLLFERASDFSIVLAYIISVCLYLNIMSAFVLGGIDMDSEYNERLLTSSIIIFIVAIGLIRGLKMLEQLEQYALYVTMAVVLMLSFAFLVHDEKVFVVQHSFQLISPLNHTTWEVLTIIAGTLIVVQGFETSRFMGAIYNADIRVKASRYSQIIATGVYVVFVSLALPIAHVLNGQYDDNSLIKLAAAVSTMLVVPLVVSAALSQFAAAIADTIAASGNIAEVSKNKINEKVAYLIIGGFAIALTWVADTYQILALASRAFALYYLLQCLVAISLSKSFLQKLWMSIVALTLLFITVFAVPAG